MFRRNITTLLLIALSSSFLFSQVKIDTGFESGCIGSYTIRDSSVIKISDKDSIKSISADIFSRFDPLNPVDTTLSPSARWYYFRMTGVKNKLVFLRIHNSEAIRPFYSYDNKNFTRLEQSENFRPGYIDKIFTQDTVYICHFIPYTYGRMLSKVQEWSKNKDVKTEVIGKSHDGLDTYMLTITDPNVADINKKIVWIHGRSHPSESPASWHLEGMVDTLLGSSEFANELRKSAVFYIVPFINPDGVFGGYSRSTSTGVNIEINWDRPDSLTMPEVLNLKKTLEKITATRKIDLFLNMHSQIENFATYWIHTAKSTSPSFFARQLLLSNLTADNNPYYISKDQSFSDMASRYAEGWMWNRFGERTLPITFETPYTYYSENREGEWVSLDNLRKFSAASLRALSDYLELPVSCRFVLDNPSKVRSSQWNKDTTYDYVHFGKEMLAAKKVGSKVKYIVSKAAAGSYSVYKWVPGESLRVSPAGTNKWKKIRDMRQKRNGRMVVKERSSSVGEKFDAILVVKD